MLYAVRLTLPTAEWDQAVARSSDVINDLNNVDEQPTGKLYEVYEAVMKVALERQHEWLSEHGMTTVITPDDFSERTFVFYFDDEGDARAFQETFTHDS